MQSIGIAKVIVGKAKELGASLAGIARIEDLKASPSYAVYAKSPFYEQYDPSSPMCDIIFARKFL